MYTKAQADGLLLLKANESDLNNKVNGSDVYLRTDADLTFQTKSDMDNYQRVSDMADYVTSGTLINNYATQLELSGQKLIMLILKHNLPLQEMLQYRIQIHTLTISLLII